MNKQFDRRLDALEQASGPRRVFVVYPDEPRYVLPGGVVTDSDTFTQAVERAGRGATVVRVQYQEDAAL